jgi:hypothetical protein
VIEPPDWRLSWEATRVALVISLPLTALASFFCLLGSGDLPAQDEAFGMGESIYYFFGFPLIRIADIFRPRGQVHLGGLLLSLPLLNFLFLAQWMIWTQLVALAGKAIDWLCWRDENKKRSLDWERV